MYWVLVLGLEHAQALIALLLICIGWSCLLASWVNEGAVCLFVPLDVASAQVNPWLALCGVWRSCATSFADVLDLLLVV